MSNRPRDLAHRQVGIVKQQLVTHLLVKNQVRVHGTSGAVRIQSKGRCQVCGTVGTVVGIAAAVAVAIVIVAVLLYERQFHFTLVELNNSVLDIIDAQVTTRDELTLSPPLYFFEGPASTSLCPRFLEERRVYT